MSDETYELNEKAAAASARGEHERAIRLYRETVATQGLNISHLNLGGAYAKAGECELARCAYDKVPDAPAVAAGTDDSGGDDVAIGDSGGEPPECPAETDSGGCTHKTRCGGGEYLLCICGIEGDWHVAFVSFALGPQWTAFTDKELQVTESEIDEGELERISDPIDSPGLDGRIEAGGRGRWRISPVSIETDEIDLSGWHDTDVYTIIGGAPEHEDPMLNVWLQAD